MRLNFFITFEDESYCNIFADYTDFQFTKTQQKLKTISHRSAFKAACYLWYTTNIKFIRSS